MGLPITDRRIIAAPWQAIHFLSKVALLHFSSQTKADTLGNDRADQGARYAAPIGPPCLFSIQFLKLPLSD